MDFRWQEMTSRVVPSVSTRMHRAGSSHLGHGGGGVVDLDGAQACGEVHHLRDIAERQAGEDTDADAPAVGISQGGMPGASETIHEVSQGFGLAYFL